MSQDLSRSRLAPALPPKPKGWEKSGTSIYGFSAAAEEPAMQEQNTVLFELHLQKQLLWLFFFMNNLDILKIMFYKNRRASSNLSHSTKSTIPVRIRGTM